MKLLLTNDDGIDAPGIEALREAVAGLGEPFVIAPAEALSGCSHRVTTDESFRVIARTATCFVVEGTPADCVRVGLHRIAPDAVWVLSGINAGGNLGADVWHSGTVAAVREAVLHGWPGIAISHYRKRGLAVDWPRAAAWTARVLRELLERPWQAGTFWNVNLPHLGPEEAEPGMVFCPLDPGPLPVSYRQEGDRLHYVGNYHQRLREIGSDVDICFGGQIAVTQLSLPSPPPGRAAGERGAAAV